MSNIYLTGYDGQRVQLELTRIRELLSRLGEPQTTLKFVHIAGTNGKGSTAALLASILRAAGYRVGLFTSPALADFSERVQVNGVPIPQETLKLLSQQVNAQAEAMADPPTEFEAATAIALLYFAGQGCDLALLEVGLGGGGDATNVIPPPELCVLTAMGLDHTGILGTTYSEIAAAKAGILKPGSRAVSFGNQPACNRVFRRRCRQLGIPLTEMNPARLTHVEASLEGLSLCISPYGALRLPLLGEYQAQNALLAVTAAEELRNAGWTLPDEAIGEGLASARWPGRFELLHRSPVFLLDGSHNPQGVAATAAAFRALFPGVRPVILMGVMGDKDLPGILAGLLPLGRQFVTVTPANPRALPAAGLAERIAAGGGSVQSCATVEEGVRRAAALAGRDGAVLALGTLYFSDDVRRSATNVFKN